KFGSVFKISRKTFNYICSLVKEDMKSNYTYTNGKILSSNDQIAVALRRLSSGESLSIIGESFGMNQSTVSHVTWRFVEAMEERGLHHLQWPSTEAQMEEIKSKFERTRGLPNCCGAIDITHIVMNLPTVDSSNGVWFDREKQHSMILQAIVDPDMRFRDIIVGWPGSLSDAQVLQSSGFFKLSEEGKRLSEKKIKLSQGTEMREYIVGDTGLKEMWRILHGVMWMPDKNRLPRIVLVCCLLHNIIVDMEDEVLDEMPLSRHHDPDYRQQFCDSVDET
ncbi:DDE_4 domain-containing protein, partial [Cephalotus follicularis]